MATKQYKVTLSDEVAEFLRTQDTRGRLSEGIDRLVQRVQGGAIHASATLAPSRHAPKEPTPVLADDGDEGWTNALAKIHGARPVDDPLAEYMHHPENPNANRNTAKRLHSDAIKAKQAAQEAHDKPRRGFKAAIRDTLANPSTAHQQPQIFAHYSDKLSDEEMITLRDEVASDPDGSIYRESQEWLAAERMRNAEKARDDARRAELMAQGMTKEEAVARMFAERGQVQTLKLTEKACKGRGVFGTPADFSDALIKELNDYWEHRELPPDDEEVTEL